MDQFNAKHLFDWAEKQREGRLNPQEEKELLDWLQADPMHLKEWESHLALLEELDEQGRFIHYKQTLQQITEQTDKPAFTSSSPISKPWISYLKMSAVAASVAVICTLGSWALLQKGNQPQETQYRLLKREIETIRLSHNHLLHSFQSSQPDQKNSPNAPIPNGHFGGTAFAIGNKGLLITNYHLTEGADSIFVELDSTRRIKAHTLSFDAESDLAILQLEEEDLLFSRNGLPYSIASGKKNLGTKVFTLAYPGEGLVYNEGYISSTNGYKGNQQQYRLEIPSNPGYSGAPVVNQAGEIVGMITGNDANHPGVTYAVRSESIHALLQTLPKTYQPIRSQRKMQQKQEDWIATIQHFTFPIRIFKSEG